MRRTVLFLRGPREEPNRVVVERRGSRCRVAGGELSDDFDAARLPDGRLSLLLEDSRQICGRGEETADGVRVRRGGLAASVLMTRARRAIGLLEAGGEPGGIEEIRALMHGRIVEVRVRAGERVEEGALLLVLEAMKMQNEIRASRAGLVERSMVEAGQTVEGGAFLLSIRSDSN